MFRKLRDHIKEKIARKTTLKIGNIFVNKISKNEYMNKFMVSIFGASWRTAVIGYMMAVFTACWPIIQNGSFDIHKDWKNLVGAAFIALFSSQSKDAKVTGLPEDNKNK